jgi:G:T-mismatch repair DNA endonuclease (very short patch repair protein)
MTAKQYNEKFGLIKKCKVCQKNLLKKNKTGFCNAHRDRRGKNNSFYGKKHKKETIDNAKIKCRRASKKNWKNKEYKEKVIKGVSKPRREGFGKEQSIALIKMYKEHPEQKQFRKIAMKKSWEEGKIVANGYSCNKSKMQEFLFEDICNLCEDKISNTTIRLEDGHYLFPDIFIEKIGLIIEFYGDYWHANPKFYKAEDIVHHGLKAKDIWKKDKERIQKFNNTIGDVSYKVIVVWQDEYINNKEQVLDSLDVLINYESCGM